MINRKNVLLFLSLVLILSASGCRSASSTEEAYTFAMAPVDFARHIDNPFLPLSPGNKYVYETKTEDGLERVEIEVLFETRVIMGVTATIMQDTVYLDGIVIEDTFDWFAQDKDGNVWYLGEDVSNYENGKMLDKAGSWEWGVDGALPGIVMYADPASHIGESYYQEYYQGEAEDMGKILSVSESVSVPYGSFNNAVQTFDYSQLDPDLQEHKYYIQGIGLVKSIDLTTGEEEVLVEYTPPSP